MTRLAIFVEGQTELEFVSRLVEELFGHKGLFVNRQRASGKAGLRSFVTLRGRTSSRGRTTTHYVLIRDCRGDSTVKSDMIDFLSGGGARNYNDVIGLRDLYPIPYSNLPKLEKGLKFEAPHSQRQPTPKVFLAVMEIEAWFLAETTHFNRLDPNLSLTSISSCLGVRLESEDIEKIAHPSAMLHQIYQLVGKAYSKTLGQVGRTLAALDYEELCINATSRTMFLADFVSRVESNAV